MNKIPSLLRGKYRRELWKNASKILKKIGKVLTIKKAYLLGSFTTKKRRPADVDVILLLKVEGKGSWSLDMVLAPDNAHGEFILEDAKKWMKQKYGSRKSCVILLE